MKSVNADQDILSLVKDTGLRYVQDSAEGILRKRAGRGFCYYYQNKRVKDEKVLKRIHSLVIPPAWNSVWICAYENGHIQATGRDARNRKQYRYHMNWSTARNETKFDKLLSFGKILPKIRKQIRHDLKLQKFTKEKILAGVISLMEDTNIRIGNDIYAKQNHSYGLTTILNRHAKVKGEHIEFKFKGKSGVLHEVELDDARLSKIIKHCQHLPGEELFAYKDENGVVHDIGSSDVNEYLQKIADAPITAKDFRTWSGTVKALETITAIGTLESSSSSAYKKRQVEIIRNVAEHLRNTVAVCRKYYVHPIIFKSDESGLIFKLIKKPKRKSKPPLLKPMECLLLQILENS